LAIFPSFHITEAVHTAAGTIMIIINAVMVKQNGMNVEMSCEMNVTKQVTIGGLVSGRDASA
jgi:hypothetical protein